MICENFNAVLKANDEHGNVLVTRARCKQWTCKACAETNRKQWNARIIDHINKTGGKWSWFTLTAHSKARGAERSINNLRGVWDKLIKRAKRRFGKFDYCRVYECHKDGSYHIHCIASFHFGDITERHQKDGKVVKYSKWLDETANDVKIGWYTHADDISENYHGGYVASYVTKYLTKFTPEFKQELGRVRHIQTSQGWAKLERNTEYTWNVATGVYVNDLTETYDNGGDVIDINTGQKLTYDDFSETYVYPNEFGVVKWDKYKDGNEEN